MGGTRKSATFFVAHIVLQYATENKNVAILTTFLFILYSLCFVRTYTQPC